MAEDAPSTTPSVGTLLNGPLHEGQVTTASSPAGQLGGWLRDLKPSMRRLRLGQERSQRDDDRDGLSLSVNVITSQTRFWGTLLLKLKFLVIPLPFLGDRNIRQFRFLHFGLFTIIDQFPYVGAPQPREHLKRRYMLYAPSFVGDTFQYIEAYALVIPSGIQFMFGADPHQMAVKDCRPMSRWKDTLLNHNLHNQHFYSAYPGATVDEIDGAFLVQTELERLRKKASDDPVEFKQQFDDFRTSVQRHLGQGG